jgi:hypothetical protein
MIIADAASTRVAFDLSPDKPSIHLWMVSSTNIFSPGDQRMNIDARRSDLGHVPTWIEILHQELEFKLMVLELNGSAFEEFFSRFMRCKSPASFSPARAGGPGGDLKCDGWDSKSKTLFAVYAPSSAKQKSEVRSKIQSDFLGALGNWPSMKFWQFVHNDLFDIPAIIVYELERLRESEAARGIEIPASWGPRDLWMQIRSLKASERRSLLPGYFADEQPQTHSGDGPVLGFQSTSPVALRAAVESIVQLCGNFQADSVLDPVATSALACALTGRLLGDDALFSRFMNVLAAHNGTEPFETQLTSLGLLRACLDKCSRLIGCPSGKLVELVSDGPPLAGTLAPMLLELAHETLEGRDPGFVVDDRGTREKFVLGCGFAMENLLEFTSHATSTPLVFLLQDFLIDLQRADHY